MCVCACPHVHVDVFKLNKQNSVGKKKNHTPSRGNSVSANLSCELSVLCHPERCPTGHGVTPEQTDSGDTAPFASAWELDRSCNSYLIAEDSAKRVPEAELLKALNSAKRLAI